MPRPAPRSVAPRTVPVRGAVWVALMALAAAAQAAEWRVQPRFNLSETWTDNVTLVEQDPEDDYITQISPGLSVRGEGGRLRFGAEYNLQNVISANDGDRNRTNHQLQADGRGEFVKHVFFVDASSRITQALVDNRERFADTNRLFDNNNRADVFTYQVSPSLRHHFGRWADAEARYTRGEVFTESNRADVSDSSRDAFELTLSSGRWFQRVPWQLSYQDTTVEGGRREQSEFRSIRGQVSYVFNRQFRASFSAGDESNSFATSRRSNDGFFWNVGGTWTPSRRTSLEARYGDRFFGHNFGFDVRHRRRHSTFSLSYSEDVQTLNRLLTEQELVQLVDEFGNPILDPPVEGEIPLPIDTPSLSRDVFVTERLNASWRYQRRRNTLTLRVNRSVRSFEAEGDEDETTNLSVSASRSLSRQTRAGVNGQWQRSEFTRTGGETQDFFFARAFVSHTLSPYLSGNLDYSYRQRSADGAGEDYTENSVSASLNVRF